MDLEMSPSKLLTAEKDIYHITFFLGDHLVASPADSSNPLAVTRHLWCRRAHLTALPSYYLPGQPNIRRR